jgi:hypothetical protein
MAPVWARVAAAELASVALPQAQLSVLVLPALQPGQEHGPLRRSVAPQAVLGYPPSHARDLVEVILVPVVVAVMAVPSARSTTRPWQFGIRKAARCTFNLL